MSESVIGQTLDDKYRIEKQLGKGGMGTVYLATHIGTERPVALKVIASEFMKRAEFIERFRREARAAGRLRHPNVVDVTDFGFSDTKDGEVAYLVMEYLDGCTLGEILKEEENLPLSWTIDILEQVCSAVHEAHEQGIIHRDLKPDNIWLEPNQRGGYTVKVLDFGIAKLEESQISVVSDLSSVSAAGAQTRLISGKETIADENQKQTLTDKKHSTVILESATMALSENADKPNLEAGTLIQPLEVASEGGTAILPGNQTKIISDDENAATKIISDGAETNKATDNSMSDAKSLLNSSSSSANLTRVGAVLGTPLYMSPEQCRGEKLTPHSDIYSLGVIAYQMLSGKTPFGGDYSAVMEAHKEAEPPNLEVKKVSKKIKRVIDSSLAKNPLERPPTAQSFASELRAQSEGIGVLLQRSLEIYSKHLPKFLGMSILLYLPFILVTVAKIAFDILTVTKVINFSIDSSVLNAGLILVTTFFGIFCGYLVFGTTTWLTAQILAVPLRPIKLRPALEKTREKWKRLVGTGLMTTVLTFLGYALCLIPGLVLSVTWALVAPVIMMENLRGKAALKRSKMLVKRSLTTTIAAVLLMFFVPFSVASIASFFVATTISSFSKKFEGDDKSASTQESVERAAAEKQNVESKEVDENKKNGDVNIVIGSNREITLSTGDKSDEKIGKRIKEVIREDLTGILMLPFQILMASFSSIIVALLYFKTRQIGGESTEDLFEQFEEKDQPARNWQKRMRERVAQSSGRTTTGKKISRTEF